MSNSHSTTAVTAGKPNKPAKPYPDFPLFAHAAGVWAKKIRGKLRYFGTWDDHEGALKKYLEQKDALRAGRAPRPDPETLTVKGVANAFLNAKAEARDAGELSPRSWLDYRTIMDMLVDGIGKHRAVTSLDPQDFATLKNQLAKKNGPRRMCTVVQVIRCAFKYAYETGLLDRPMRFGPVFKRTSKKTLRLHRAKQGPKLFTADEIRRMLADATLSMRAMILLGINCGFGNADCATLPMVALDLENGWVDYARPKIGIARRCLLWAQTVEAIREVLAERKEPNDKAAAGLVFITKYRTSWSKDNSAGPITQAMRKLLKKLAINGHRNFYTLRHSFRTVADETKDSVACDAIMGHETPHMSSVYRETISNARLKAVAEYVRSWLFAQPTKTANDEEQ
jgi:integrase